MIKKFGYLVGGTFLWMTLLVVGVTGYAIAGKAEPKFSRVEILLEATAQVNGSVKEAVVISLPPLLIANDSSKETVLEIIKFGRENPEHIEAIADGFVTVVTNAIMSTNSKLSDMIVELIYQEGGELAALFGKKLKASFTTSSGAYVIPLKGTPTEPAKPAPFSIGNSQSVDTSPAN